MPQMQGYRRVLAVAVAAALAGAVLGVKATPVGADMLLANDGKWYPASEPPLGPTDEPGDDLLAQSAEHKADATYETVKLAGAKGVTKPAGQVVKILSSARTSQEFRQSLNDASSQFWKEAAEGFLTAAEAAQGFGKQEALWSRAQAYWYGQMPAEMNA